MRSAGWSPRALALGMLALLLACVPAAAAVQEPAKKLTIGGEVSVIGLTMPHQPAGSSTHEFRSRARLEVTGDLSPWLRVKFDGTVDGLVADRAGRVDTVIARAREAWVEARGARGDLRVGYGRLVWGRLDEIMPSDVLNPLETSRYFLEGRSEARLPLAFARGRAFLTEDTTIEGVVTLPGRRGRFDELDEPTSPFNLVRDLVLPAAVPGMVRRIEPNATWDNLQLGGRLSSTLGRVDASVSAYRGFEAFGTLSFEPRVSAGTLIVGELVERYSTFTMFATDAEAVVGPWAIRAEAAMFVDQAFDVGVGVDRSAGDYRIFTSVVWHRDWATEGPPLVNNDVSLIGSVERKFARDRYLVRLFGVANPVDASGFVRGIAAWSVRDNVALEGSAGVFLGSKSSSDTLSRFRDRDFVFVRLRWYF